MKALSADDGEEALGRWMSSHAGRDCRAGDKSLMVVNRDGLVGDRNDGKKRSLEKHSGARLRAALAAASRCERRSSHFTRAFDSS